MPYEFKDNTYSKTPIDDNESRVEIEVGDAKQLDFKPQFKIKRWDNEVNFSIRAEEEAGATLEKDGELIKYKAKDYEVHMYDKPDASDDGGFEFEWYLKKKPILNVFSATIQSRGLDFFYQPQLDEMFQMPENVVGSYAVYHSTKKNHVIGGNNYKGGKAFHIYLTQC